MALTPLELYNALGNPGIHPIDVSLLVLKTPTRTAGLNKIHPILGDNMLQPQIFNNILITPFQSNSQSETMFD